MHYISTLHWSHPVKQLVPITTARQWPSQHCRLTRKYDGEFCVREIGGRTLLGELVKYKSGGFFTAEDRRILDAHGELFAAWDCVAIDGQSIANQPLSMRDAVLESFRAVIWDNWIIAAAIITDVDAVLASGAEGVVRNEWHAPYGKITVCKRGEIYLCQVVCRPGSSQSVPVQIISAESGSNDGIVQGKITFVPMRGGKCDQVKQGSLVRIEGLGLTDDGRIREPNTASNWLVKE
jgi:hypothetical protein